MIAIPSETIWHDEIFAGMKNYIKTLYGDTVNVYVLKPDEDFKEDKYPLITLQIPYYKFSIDRWYKKDKYVSEITDKGTFIVDEPPLPFDITLQVDMYAKQYRDISNMDIKWLSRIHHDLLIPAKNRGGEDVEIYMEETESVRSQDDLKSINRVFRKIHTLKVHGKIEEHDAREEWKVPTNVKVISYLLNKKKVVYKNEIQSYRHLGSTPHVYTVRRSR